MEICKREWKVRISKIYGALFAHLVLMGILISESISLIEFDFSKFPAVVNTST